MNLPSKTATSAGRYPLPTTGQKFDFRPNGRISPFFDCTNAAGARAYQRHLNSYMSWEFGDAADEQYQALLTSATLVDVHSLHVIQIKGPDALGLADRLVCHSIPYITDIITAHPALTHASASDVRASG